MAGGVVRPTERRSFCEALREARAGRTVLVKKRRRRPQTRTLPAKRRAEGFSMARVSSMAIMTQARVPMPARS